MTVCMRGDTTHVNWGIGDLIITVSGMGIMPHTRMTVCRIGLPSHGDGAPSVPPRGATWPAYKEYRHAEGCPGR